jgi:hypothetical protein
VALGLAGESGLARLGLSARSVEAGETFPPPAQRRQPSISAVADDEKAEAGARVLWGTQFGVLDGGRLTGVGSRRR